MDAKASLELRHGFHSKSKVVEVNRVKANYEYIAHIAKTFNVHWMYVHWIQMEILQNMEQ